MMTFAQMTALSAAELQKELEAKAHELLEVQMGIQLGQEKNTAKKTKLGKYIARLTHALKLQQSLTPATS